MMMMIKLYMQWRLRCRPTPCLKKMSPNSLRQISTDFRNSYNTGKRRKFLINHIHYFPSHLKYVDALPLGIQKFKFVANLEENANKKCHMNQLSVHEQTLNLSALYFVD